jgi:hypothetical protein
MDEVVLLGWFPRGGCGKVSDDGALEECFEGVCGVCELLA